MNKDTTTVSASDFSSVQEAIDHLAKYDGARVLTIPKGTTETGPLELISNLTIILEKGAVLKFKDDPHLYKPIWTRWEGIECHAMHPLLYATDGHDIAITGEGIIDGNGAWWWRTFAEIERTDRTQPQEDYELELARLNPDYKERAGGGARPSTQFLRPPLIQFWKCTAVKLKGITVQNSPFWTIHFVYCTQVTIDGVTVRNPANAINTDALDIDSSTNVAVSNSLFDVGDDAITLKSGSGSDGLRINKPTAHVNVKDCTILASHGGIAIGSETAGGINDVSVEKCTFSGTQRGIRLKSRRGRGGTIEGICLRHLEMDHCWCPIVLGMYFAPGVLPQEEDYVLSKSAQPVEATTPHIRNIKIEDVRADNVRSTAAFIVGLPESPIENVSIDQFEWHLAPEEELMETWHTEPTKGLFHDADRGLKTINVRNLYINGEQR